MPPRPEDSPVIAFRHRYFPQPLLSVALTITWIVATASASMGNLAFAAGLGVVTPWMTARFWPEAPGLRGWVTLARFGVILLWDIVVANLNVARLIVSPNSRLHPMFLEVPVDIEHPLGITLFAAAITLTPGTVSANLSGDRRVLLVHSLDGHDAQSQIQFIKARYEAPLMEVFT